MSANFDIETTSGNLCFHFFLEWLPAKLNLKGGRSFNHLTCDQARQSGVEEGSGGDVQAHHDILLGFGLIRPSVEFAMVSFMLCLEVVGLL